MRNMSEVLVSLVHELNDRSTKAYRNWLYQQMLSFLYAYSTIVHDNYNKLTSVKLADDFIGWPTNKEQDTLYAGIIILFYILVTVVACRYSSKAATMVVEIAKSKRILSPVRSRSPKRFFPPSPSSKNTKMVSFFNDHDEVDDVTDSDFDLGEFGAILMSQGFVLAIWKKGISSKRILKMDKKGRLVLTKSRMLPMLSSKSYHIHELGSIFVCDNEVGRFILEAKKKAYNLSHDRQMTFYIVRGLCALRERYSEGCFADYIQTVSSNIALDKSYSRP